MNVTTKNVKTYCVEMTEDQAHDLLRVSTTYTDWVKAFPDVEKTTDQKNIIETLNALGQALLTAGVYLTNEKDK